MKQNVFKDFKPTKIIKFFKDFKPDLLNYFPSNTQLEFAI